MRNFTAKCTKCGGSEHGHLPYPGGECVIEYRHNYSHAPEMVTRSLRTDRTKYLERLEKDLRTQLGHADWKTTDFMAQDCWPNNWTLARGLNEENNDKIDWCIWDYDEEDYLPETTDQDKYVCIAKAILLLKEQRG